MNFADLQKLERLSLEEIQQLRQEAEKNWKRADNKFQEAAAEESKARTHLNYLKNLEMNAERIAALKATANAPTTVVPSDADKSTTILQFVRQRGIKGLKPREVEAALISAGVDLKEGYVHAALSRLAKRGQVKRENGKYFPIENKTTSE